MTDQNSITNPHPDFGLTGLIVCGGKSRRMGTDKSMLVYFNKPLRYELYDMLAPYCEKVFISCNGAQVAGIGAGYSAIVDLSGHENIGPMAALLSFFTQFPGKDLLVIGCDYPFISGADINNFVNAIEAATLAAAFYNPETGYYEPLLAYYDHKAAEGLFKMYSNKEYSLQHFLKRNNAGKFTPENINCMQSVDTLEGYTEAITVIRLSK